MAKVYSAPKEIVLPVFNFRDMEGSRKDEQRYIDEVIAWAKKHSKDQYAGTIIRIPHADGYAIYVTFKSSPVTLIHLNIGDGWDAPLAHRLLKKDIVDYAKRG